MAGIGLSLLPLVLMQAAPLAEKTPIIDNRPVLLSEEEWRPAAVIWSNAVGRRAQSLYSRRPLRLGLEGYLTIQFTIGTDGRTKDCMIQTSSGSEELDAVGCTALLLSGKAPVLLDENGIPKEQAIVLPMRFVIGDDYVTE